MRARDLIYETGDAIIANRVRSLLTILGIVIGIAAVIAITALIDGMKQQIVNQLGLNLSRVVSITCWPPGNQGLDMDDVEQLSNELSADYEFITGYTYAYVEKVTSDTAETNSVEVIACTPDNFTLRGSKPATGRFFTDEEEAEGTMMVVLGGSAVADLFGSPDADCVGQTVRIGNDRYTVVGTIANTENYQNYAIFYLPYSTAKTRIIGSGSYGGSMQLMGFAREGSDMYAVAESTASYLRAKYNIPEPEDDGMGGDSQTGYVYVYTAQETIDQLDQTMGAFRLIALAVAGISLLVGGIGIMNMMLTNVTERIREIGLRKSLGARRSDITAQFLLESIALCLVGGVFGILAGYGGAWALAGVAGSAMGYENLMPVITAESVFAASGICVGIGILFGYYPARRAAKLDPVESLRYQ